MKFSFLIVFILSAAGFISAQTNVYKIRAKNRQIVITYKGKSHIFNLDDKIDAAILFADRKAQFVYLVLDISGQSKIKEDNRQCGAGIESNFIWIKLDANWKILDSKSVRYESCWSSISNDNYQKQGSKMSIEIRNFRDDLDIKLFYNSEEPEKGFQISEKPLENLD